MTAAELRAWIKRRGLTHAAAARLLAMSIKGLCKNLYGETRISPRTERMVQLVDLLARLENGIAAERTAMDALVDRLISK
jgi:hypothetical protein